MSKPIDIAVQKYDLELKYPDLKCKLLRNKGLSKLIIHGGVQPTPLSMFYKYQLIYVFRKSPDIEILEPKLVSISPDISIPHVYAGNKLCLYYPKTKEWDSTKLISKYIIPWISEWLYFYEVWHSTGEWLGGGIHPKSKSS